MKLYLIRHAPAQERHVFAQTGQSDDLRPLTPRGQERMHDVIQVFKKKESSIDLFLQSPFTRCQQTGDIFKEYYPHARFKTSDNLRPDHSAQ
ncbi:MAG: phosphoglycerate mutase family protein [Pseudomonadota bacterium]